MRIAMTAALLCRTGRGLVARVGPVRCRPFSAAAAATGGDDGPVASWSSLGIGESLASCAARSWPAPNAVQRATISALTADPLADAVVGSETGSGKTLAYLLPAAAAAIAHRKEDALYPAALVLVPNRELGTQLQRVAGQLGAATGGAPLGDAPFTLSARHGGRLERWPFRRGECPDVLVATPSFAAAFDKDLDFWDAARVLVLDEADMLLDGGFKRDIERCLVALKRVERLRAAAEDLVEDAPDRCRRIIVAATLPDYGLRSVDSLVAKHVPDAITICGEDGAAFRMHGTVPSLAHAFVDAAADGEARLSDLAAAIDASERTIVFCRTGPRALAVAEALEARGIPAAPYAKTVDAADRLATLDAFARGNVPVLVATDLAARGLDLPAVDHVVQYDFATDVVSHLHRVGRAARHGRAAKATSFVTDGDALLVAAVEKGGPTVEAAFSRRRGLRKKKRKADAASEVA